MHMYAGPGKSDKADPVLLFYIHEELHRSVSNHNLLGPFRQRLLIKHMSTPSTFVLLRPTHFNTHLLVDVANHFPLLILSVAIRLLVPTRQLEAHAIARLDGHLGPHADYIQCVREL